MSGRKEKDGRDSPWPTKTEYTDAAYSKREKSSSARSSGFEPPHNSDFMCACAKQLMHAKDEKGTLETLGAQIQYDCSECFGPKYCWRDCCSSYFMPLDIELPALRFSWKKDRVIQRQRLSHNHGGGAPCDCTCDLARDHIARGDQWTMVLDGDEWSCWLRYR